MSDSIEKMRQRTDDELIAEHDKRAINTTVGTAYYLDELHRREQIRALEESHRLARASFWLSVTNTLLAGIAAIVALAR